MERNWEYTVQVVEERVKDTNEEDEDGFRHTGMDYRLRLLDIIWHYLVVLI